MRKLYGTITLVLALLVLVACRNSNPSHNSFLSPLPFLLSADPDPTDPIDTNVIIGVIGLLIGVAGLLVAIRTKRQDRQIAEAQGAYRRPNLKLYVLGFSLESTSGNWVFIRPGTPGDWVIYTVPFLIVNCGDAPSEEIIMTITIPKAIHPASMDNGLDFKILPSLLDTSVRRSVDEVGNFTLLSYAIPPLGPNRAVRIDDAFAVGSSFDQTIDVRTAIPGGDSPNRGVLLSVTLGIEMAYLFTIALRSLNAAGLKFTMRVGAIAASNLTEGVRKYVEFTKKARWSDTHTRRLFLKRFLDELRDKWDWLRGRWRLEYWNFLAFNIAREVDSGSTRVYAMKPRRSVKRHFLLLDEKTDVAELVETRQHWEQDGLVTVVQSVKYR